MQPETETRHAPRWMKILLAVSLALNFLVLGVVLGAVAFGGLRDGSRDADRANLSTLLLRALPEADQRALRRALRGDREEMRASRQEARAARSDMVVALRQDPFDETAFAAALETQREIGQSIMAVGQGALVAHVGTMSQAERVAYADRLEALNTRRGPPRE
jgi:uncharacterized membrane protein